MARPKAFNPEKVLDKAIELLWDKGYEKTSVQDLVDHLGIGRGSLYDTFGGKRELYMAALERYRLASARKFARVLSQPQPVQANLHQLLKGIAAESLADPHRRGCFVTNATTELAAHDTAVAAQIAANRERIVATLEQAMMRAQAAGEIGPHLDPTALASFFFNTVQGLRVVAKTSPTPDMLAEIVDTALLLLE